MIKRTLFALAVVAAFCAPAGAQKGTAEPGFYPQGYSGDTWTGEVTAVDNDNREITLAYTKGKKSESFTFVVPDGPFGWGKDAGGDKVLMFAPGGNDKKAAAAPPRQQADLNEFMGRRVKVYYKRREKKDPGGEKVKYNEAFHIEFLKAEKK